MVVFSFSFGVDTWILKAMIMCMWLIWTICLYFCTASFCFGADSGTKGPADRRLLKETEMDKTSRLTDEEGRYLLSLARSTIEKDFFPGAKTVKGDDEGCRSGVFDERRGTFVTLTKGGSLRGCIGHIIPQESILEGVKENALNAAFRDPRFQPLKREELKDIKIEVSILTEPKSLSYSNEKDLLAKLRPGIDGVIIKKGFRQSTFLPQVWEQLPGKEDFLSHLCLKAGLPADAWKRGDLSVSTYQVQAFEE
jgi:AmmeMemoRadiSam system protein A